MIDGLSKLCVKASLIIQGEGDMAYYLSLVNLVKELELSHLIKITFKSVSFDKINSFFDYINCFLITSKYEGGPNIALEVMAYGLPLLSYDVGAIKDRLNGISNCIASDLNELIKNAIIYLEYSELEFVDRCKTMKDRYVELYSNASKIKFLHEFIKGS